MRHNQLPTPWTIPDIRVVGLRIWAVVPVGWRLHWCRRVIVVGRRRVVIKRYKDRRAYEYGDPGVVMKMVGTPGHPGMAEMARMADVPRVSGMSTSRERGTAHNCSQQTR